MLADQRHDTWRKRVRPLYGVPGVATISETEKGSLFDQLLMMLEKRRF